MSDGHGGHLPQGGPRHLAGPREGRERQRDDRSSSKRSRSPHSPRGPPPPERRGGSGGSWEQHDRRGGSDRPDWRARGGPRDREHNGPLRHGPGGDWRAGRGPSGPPQWQRARRDDGPRGWGRESSPPPRRGRDRSPDYTDADQGSRRRASPDYKDSGPTARRHEPLPSRDRSSSPGPRRGQPAFVPRNVQQPASLGGSSRPRPRSRSPEGIRGGSGGGSNTQLRGPSGKVAGSSSGPIGAERAGAMAAAAAAVAAKLSGGSGLSLDQKKKLLWGGKKKEVAVEPAPQAVFGQNRWDRAEFGSEQDRLKFIKLMGGKAAAETLLQHGPALEAPSGAAGAEPPAFGPALPGGPGRATEEAASGAAAAGQAAAGGPATNDPCQPDGYAAAAGVAQGPALQGPELPGLGVLSAAEAAADPSRGPSVLGGVPGAADIMKRDAQARVLSQLEREFESGLRRQLGGNRAAGLGAL
ncbi:hypothetical protein ABPG77_008075 [Micractinium sp. CCAP 211/92]